MTLSTTTKRNRKFPVTHHFFSAFVLVVLVAGGCSEDKPLVNPVNRVPVIDSMYAVPETLGLNGIADVGVVAHDEDNNTLTYEWSAEKGTFLGTLPNRPSRRWQAPLEEGWVTIAVTVADLESTVRDTLELLVLAESGDLSGTVTAAATGDSLEGAAVSFGGFSDLTDEDGRYRITTIPVGNYMVEASLEGYVTSLVAFEVKNGSNELDFALQVVGDVGTITGVVTNSLDDPVEDAMCSIRSLDISTQTDSQGMFRFEGVPNETYLVEVFKEGYRLESESGIEVNSDEVSVELELDALPIDPPVLAASRDDGTTVTLTWDPPPVETVAGYLLFYREGEGSTTPLIDDPLPGSQTSYETSGELHTRYRYRIQVLNVDGETGDASQMSNAVVLTPPSELVSIPAGEVVMGDTPPSWPDGSWGTASHPGNPVPVEAFSIEATEVDNRQFQAFLHERLSTSSIVVVPNGVQGDETEGSNLLLNTNASKIRFDSGTGLFTILAGFEDHPVTGVTWYGAQAYAEQVDRRLPTEAEWERAARGDSKIVATYSGSSVGYGTKYPWGLDDPSVALANYDDLIGSTMAAGTLSGGATIHWDAPIHHMAGNVWEWCADWVGPYVDPHDPPEDGTQRVLRGGSWLDGPLRLRVGDRFSSVPTAGSPTSGFRCAKD